MILCIGLQSDYLIHKGNPNEEANASKFPSGEYAICSTVPLPQRASWTTPATFSEEITASGWGIVVPANTGNGIGVVVGGGMAVAVKVVIALEVGVERFVFTYPQLVQVGMWLREHISNIERYTSKCSISTCRIALRTNTTQ